MSGHVPGEGLSATYLAIQSWVDSLARSHARATPVPPDAKHGNRATQSLGDWMAKFPTIRTLVRYHDVDNRHRDGAQPTPPEWRTGTQQVDELAASVDERRWSVETGKTQHLAVGHADGPLHLVFRG